VTRINVLNDICQSSTRATRNINSERQKVNCKVKPLLCFPFFLYERDVPLLGNPKKSEEIPKHHACRMKDDMKIAAFLVLLFAELIRGDVSYNVLNREDPCISLCEKAPTTMHGIVCIASLHFTLYVHLFIL